MTVILSVIHFSIIILLLILVRSTKTKKKLCFHSNHAGERGTEVAMYDYADFSEQMLGYKVHIIFPAHGSDGLGMKRFQKRFNVTTYEVYPRQIGSGGVNLLKHLKEVQCDWLYIIKEGLKKDKPAFPTTFVPKTVPFAVHAVFHYEQHGDAYAAISPDAAGKISGRNIVPHIVRPVNMEAFQALKGRREEFRIEPQTLVICRYGGKDSFDIPFVHQVVWDMVKEYNASQLQFLFMNTDIFLPREAFIQIEDKHGKIQRFPQTTFPRKHPQIKHLIGTVDPIEKEQFLRTCNAMLHARKSGESFGLAIAEFSVHNLPVITYPGIPSQEHLRILGGKGFIYTNAETLKQILSRFLKQGIPIQDYNAYRNYTPEIVMKQFKQYFLDPIFP
jgi:hypothetical protein